MERHPAIPSIAGSDCSEGAGTQVDIKVISALGGYTVSAITVATVQNTLRVCVVRTTSPETVCGQIEAVTEDLQPVTIKIGMVNDIQTAHVIVDCIRKYSPEHIIYDPVTASASGWKLMTNEAIEKIKRGLLPLVTSVTPNIDEAKVLIGRSIQNTQDMLEAAKQLPDSYQTHTLTKGGHLEGDRMCDLLYPPDHTHYIYEEKKIESKNPHGTGCTPSSAIASYLAKGYSMKEFIRYAKEYIAHAIIAGKDLNIGHSNGPLWHFPDSTVQTCIFCAAVSQKSVAPHLHLEIN